MRSGCSQRKGIEGVPSEVIYRGPDHCIVVDGKEREVRFFLRWKDAVVFGDFIYADTASLDWRKWGGRWPLPLKDKDRRHYRPHTYVWGL